MIRHRRRSLWQWIQLGRSAIPAGS